jgi:hypothetical protein
MTSTPRPLTLIVCALMLSLLFPAPASLAQTPQKPGVIGITIHVTDSLSHNPLTDATLTLFRLRPEKLIARRRGGDGVKFSGLLPGHYLLVTSYQGYGQDSASFTITKTDSTDRELTITLSRASQNLLQVVVHATIPPVIIRQDTIVYNAGAYPSPPNSTLEDLIRKLPGLSVDQDGHVTMQGKPVDKLLIDGKEFFLGDLTMATQNLPSDIVASIEAFDTQSERAKLLGLKESSGSKTLNIRLKKKIRRGFVGKGELAAGSSDNYSANANLAKFHDDQWVFANTGAASASNKFRGSSVFPGTDNGYRHSANGQLNYRDALAKGLQATFNLGGNENSNFSESELTRQTVVPDSSILEDRLSKTHNRSSAFNASAVIEWKIDSLTTLNLHTGYSDQTGNSLSSDSARIMTQKTGISYLSSVGGTVNSNTNHSDQLTNSLDFRRQFSKKGRQVYINLTGSASGQQQPAAILSLIEGFDSAENRYPVSDINQQSTQKTTSNIFSVNASYTEPLGKRHILDFNYAYNRSSGLSDKQSLDFDSLSGKYDLPDSLTTNILKNHTTVQRFSAGFNTTEGKYRFQLGLSGQLTDLYNINLVTNLPLSQRTVNWNPRASLLWELDKGENLNLSYNGNTTAPTIDQLQPVPDLTNPYLVKIGNPGLSQQITHNLSAAYSAFNAKTFQNWQVSLNGDYTQNQISSSTTVLAGGVQQIQYVNVQGVYHLSSFITFGFPINKQKNGNASFSIHGNYGHDISLEGGQTNNVLNTGIGGSGNIAFHSGDKLFIDCNAGIDETRSGYSIPLSPPAQTLNENLQSRVSYRFPRSFTLTSRYNLQVTGSQNSLPGRTNQLWDLALYKTLFPKKTGEIRFSAFDLLNSASSFSQSIGPNYTQTVRSNQTGRYFQISFIFRPKAFNG